MRGEFIVSTFVAAVIASNFMVETAVGGTPTGLFKQAGQGACQAVPTINPSFIYLLTDATVMIQDQTGAATNWWRLTPDNTGSYLCGTWTQLASLPSSFVYGPRFFGAAVWPDGRFVIAGGEYNLGNSNATDDNQAAIYNPATNQWLPVRPPPGWTTIGDAEATVLANGQWLLSNSQTKQQALFNANNLTWTPTGSAFNPASGNNDEAGWTLLPDGSIFTVYSNVVFPNGAPGVTSGPQQGARWIAGNLPSSSAGATIGTWYPAGASQQQLFDLTGEEMGPSVLLPDGTVLNIGATGLVEIYTPPPVTSPPSTLLGSWAKTTTLPATCGASGNAQCVANDAPAALLPSGNVLHFAGPIATGVGTCPAPCEFPAGSQFFELDRTQFPPVWNQVALPGALATQISTEASYNGALMTLPNGQVLFTDGINNSSPPHNNVWTYTPQGTANPAWQPTITSFPAVITRNETYNIYGYLFNGMSQANFYGDDFQNATNYPIVQVTMAASPNHIYYGRTHNHSSMGVAQTTLPVSTKFELWTCPQIAGAACVAETGAATLVVIANGIASAPVNVTIQ
jgi:hypothetical protein